MKFWLTCFVLLFTGAELFEWFSQLESWQASGIWLVLGGMGLAAASNAAHLPLWPLWLRSHEFFDAFADEASRSKPTGKGHELVREAVDSDDLTTG